MRLAYIIAIPILLIPFGQTAGEDSSSVSLGESPIDTYTIEIVSEQQIKPKIDKIHKSANLPKAMTKTAQVKRSELAKVELTKSTAKKTSKNTVEQNASTKQAETQSPSAKKQIDNSENQNSQSEKQNDKPEKQNPDPDLESSLSHSNVIYSQTHFIDVERMERSRNIDNNYYK